MCDTCSIAFSATTIWIVVQLGLAIMRRGAFFASSGLTSGTTSGTSASMRKALELSIMTAPCLVIVSANSREVPAPAEVRAKSHPLEVVVMLQQFDSYILSAEFIDTARAALRTEQQQFADRQVALLQNPQKFLAHSTAGAHNRNLHLDKVKK